MSHLTDFSERMPTEIESRSAEQLRQIIAGQIRDDGPTSLKVALDAGGVSEIVLTPAVARTLLDVLRLIASGNGFELIPIDAQLTTQQAADLLNVSRPHLIKLIDRDDLHCTMVGRHRRIAARDLFAYKAKRDERRARILEEMATSDAEKGYL